MASEASEAPVPAEEEVEQVVAAAGIVEAQHDKAAVMTMEEQRARLLEIVRRCPDDASLSAHYNAVHDGLQSIGATVGQQSALIAAMNSDPSKSKTANLINQVFASAENLKKHEIDDDLSRQIEGDVQQGGVQMDAKPKPPAMPQPAVAAVAAPAHPNEPAARRASTTRANGKI